MRRAAKVPVLSLGERFTQVTGVVLSSQAAPTIFVSGITNITFFGGPTDGFVAKFS